MGRLSGGGGGGGGADAGGGGGASGAAGPDLSKIADAVQKQEGWFPGSRSQRNNNPGNLKFGPRARKFGATHADAQGHAVFPNYGAGRSAMEDLLKSHSGKSLAEIGKTYAEDPNWARGVAKAAGIDPSKPLGLSKPAEAAGGGEAASFSDRFGGMAAGGGAAPPQGAAGGETPYRLSGKISMEGEEYNYGSGGRGRGATPPGSYNVNIGKGDIGSVGQRIGSVATVGAPGGEIKDPRYSTPREGIQIHGSSSSRLDQLYSQGCFSVSKADWPKFKQHLLDLDRRTPGGLRIDVDKNGRAQIVARNQPVVVGGNRLMPH